jgi:hypothetical protein
MKGYPHTHFLEYTNNSTPQGRHGTHAVIHRRNVSMPNKTPKQLYEIIQHRRGLLLYDPVKKKYVPNRRGRPKHFPLPKHVQQYLQKRGVA